MKKNIINCPFETVNDLRKWVKNLLGKGFCPKDIIKNNFSKILKDLRERKPESYKLFVTLWKNGELIPAYNIICGNGLHIPKSRVYENLLSQQIEKAKKEKVSTIKILLYGADCFVINPPNKISYSRFLFSLEYNIKNNSYTIKYDGVGM